MAFSTTYQTNEFDDYQRFEEERVNLLNEGTGSQGTGQRWFGESFNTTRERSKSFDFPNVLASEGATVKVAMAGRGASSSSFSVQVGDKNVNSTTISSVKVGDSEAVYATIGTAESLFPVESDQISVSISYPPRGSGTNVAWLDYVEVTARRRLAFVSPQMRFQDIRSIAFPSTNFQLATAGSNPTIWDISDPLVPKRQQTQSSGDGLSFGVSSDEQLREFIAFDANADFSAPIAIGSIPNQNLHAIDQVDMLIVYHPEFEEATQKIAEHRRNFSGLQVATANIFDLYNEFSSGSQDPTAIRDMARLLYDRSDKFRFLLLVGDGSYDYKNIYNHAKEGDERNFIPVFETTESLDPILGYPSDDYYAMLSPNEGPSLRGALDLAIGRMTVRTSTEAMNVVDKIIQYDQNPGFLRDWRNRITFVADDEDTNLHVRDADRIAVQIDTTHRVFNINKIYLDAYQQEATPGGARYPQAQQALNRDIFRGALVVNYLGHGGSRGWAQERVLTISDILSWKNQTQLPLLITATCSFTGYDEPTITSAGEESLLNGEGGVIGLFTTVRAVYASSNFRLTRSVFDIIFEDRDMPIGEILMRSKNANSSDNSNARKFTLIGDPAMRLAIPQYSVATTEINGRDISTGFVDTLRALEKVNIKGFVQGDNGQIMSDFNGKVYPTIYDKRIVVSTLGQDERSSPREFEIQRNVIFKGVASVVNGRFAFDFVVPKDIDYNFGLGKISYYAEDGRQNDARGFFENVIIGGASSEKFADDQGPLVEVFMNNEDFIFGGQTDESPTLLVKLSDDNGINVAGNSIGHDLS
ncbi:MAG: type IX secretion system sortase PorU, partial [Bacteroidota bacterium]